MKTIIAVITIIFIMTTSIIVNITNQSFYHRQFISNNTYQHFGDQQLVNSQAKSLINYTVGQTDSLDATFFSPQAIRHMKDVRELVIPIKYLSVISIISLICFITYAIANHRSAVISRSLSLAGKIALITTLLSLLTIALFWQQAFLTFHHLAFRNRDWLFDPHDTLVNLLPEAFFLHLTQRILLTLSLFSIILISLGKIKKFANVSGR